jgi:hypothetical protein
MTMTETTAWTGTPPRPYWLPNGCPDWCEMPEAHSDEDHPDDRHHATGEIEVELTLEPPLYGFPRTAGVWLDQHMTDAEPCIHLQGQCLTLREARQLAANLNELCDRATP